MILMWRFIHIVVANAIVNRQIVNTRAAQFFPAALNPLKSILNHQFDASPNANASRHSHRRMLFSRSERENKKTRILTVGWTRQFGLGQRANIRVSQRNHWKSSNESTGARKPTERSSMRSFEVIICRIKSKRKKKKKKRRRFNPFLLCY